MSWKILQANFRNEKPLAWKNDGNHINSPAQAALRTFKSRIELLREESERWLEDYSARIMRTFWYWNWNLDDELRQRKANAVMVFGEYLAKINFNQPNNREIYLWNPSEMILSDLFLRCIICYLLDFDEIENRLVMKIYLEKLITDPSEDELIMADLYEFFDVVIEATKINILEWHINVDLSFYDKL
ncbi:MAG: hypothetical protein ACD_2C00015G0005 [uncultured bacterium (gcode 4)]|uniref:Uncharacterized protein n=1 Tax=uncultured bacterium (gcode 4) TaxID=1234023 RepID=K2FGK1_9BACT|nr:MAG: hypothetical protein ACD_2C00015G0005 [uncultured bacterium (gcode 4)]